MDFEKKGKNGARGAMISLGVRRLQVLFDFWCRQRRAKDPQCCSTLRQLVARGATCLNWARADRARRWCSVAVGLYEAGVEATLNSTVSKGWIGESDETVSRDRTRQYLAPRIHHVNVIKAQFILYRSP